MKRLLPALVLVVLGALGAVFWIGPGDGSDHGPSGAQPAAQPSAARGADTPGTLVVGDRTVRCGLTDVTVRSYDKVVHRGRVDLCPTVRRIVAKKPHPHRNDGGVFKNRERRLPQKPLGHYHEFVHPTRGLSGPGPQRLVTGADGRWYYTPDHYETFQRLDEENR